MIAVDIVLGLADLVVLVLVGEALHARRAPSLDGYQRDHLDGIFGPPGEPIAIAWIGDSVSAGVGASTVEFALPRLVARALGVPVQLSVFAVSGARVADAVSLQLPHLEEVRPDWVVVEIGGNDVIKLTSKRGFMRSMNALLSGIAASKPKHVLVLGIGEFAASILLKQPLRALAGWRGHWFDRLVREEAARHGAVYVDIVDHAGPAFVKDPARYHARDGFHPSDDGYGLWEAATVDAIRRAGWLED